MSLSLVCADTRRRPAGQPIKIVVTPPDKEQWADQLEQWALIALCELNGKLAQASKTHPSDDAVGIDALGVQTPSTSASLSPRTGSPSGASPPAFTPLAPPPGLFVAPPLAPPPGIFFPKGCRAPPGLPPPSAQLAALAAARAGAAPPSPSAEPECAEWFIQNIFRQLKRNCSSALVSSSVRLGGCNDIRLHFVPGQDWSTGLQAIGRGRPACEKRGRGDGLLRLKLDGSGEGVVLKFYLFVGTAKRGPFVCDFSDTPVQEVPLGVHWREHLEANSMNLFLRLELVD
eukprot:CAMPEP_0204214168 /NCGR_PEP_ID=MMETSP0361-20130328/76532_1 /ASSEMBLY_ACC=CAM_ASM_000343 /TAXON_ID=268821 /ORGANISM="Scrippsiella Hangoei, Strain SHTV-5" /LENGTH=286 /DNA_ID=CAMNT_0051178751 /DNA_START=92 /DNA_END=953 /DNA_ORIENTATION=-